jgi:hypothetical protein
MKRVELALYRRQFMHGLDKGSSSWLLNPGYKHLRDMTRQTKPSSWRSGLIDHIKPSRRWNRRAGSYMPLLLVSTWDRRDDFMHR